MLISIVAMLIYTPIASLFTTVLSLSVFVVFCVLTILIGMRWNLSVVWKLHSQMA